MPKCTCAMNYWPKASFFLRDSSSLEMVHIVSTMGLPSCRRAAVHILFVVANKSGGELWHSAYLATVTALVTPATTMERLLRPEWPLCKVIVHPTPSPPSQNRRSCPRGFPT